DDEAPIVVAGVETGADGGRPDIELLQLLGCFRDVVRAAADAGGVAAEFLAERDRHGILKVRAPRLEHIGEFVALAREAFGEVAGGCDERTGAEQESQPRRGWKN